MEILKLGILLIFIIIAFLQGSPKLKHLLGIRFPQFKLFDPQKRYKKAIAKRKVELIQLPEHGEADYMKTHVVTDNTPIALFVLIGFIPVMLMPYYINHVLYSDAFVALILIGLSSVVYFQTKTDIHQYKHQLKTGYQDFFVILYPDVVIRKQINPLFVKCKMTLQYVFRFIWFVGLPLLFIWLFFWQSLQT